MVYIHDVLNEMLYALPEEPTIVAKTNRYGDTKAWKVSIELEVSSPHNIFKKGRWKIPLTQTRRDEYHPRRVERLIIASFKTNHYPEGDLISESEYLEIKKEYDQKSGVGW